jgi:hypothetical protein
LRSATDFRNRSAKHVARAPHLRGASDGDILSQMAEERKKHPAAVALGRLGGKKRAANLSADKLREQAKTAAAARWAKSKPSVESPKGEMPDLVIPQPVREGEANFEGRDSNAILALREQGYEVGEPARHPDGLLRVNVRSHDVSAWVTTGKELLDLAAGRVTLDGIMNRRRSDRSTAAGGPA